MNIHAISKLVRRPPSSWMSTLRSMERGREIMRSLYAPLKHAIVAELEEPGKGLDVLQATLDPLEPATASQASVRERSYQALTMFQEQFRPRIGRLVENYLTPDYNPPPVPFNGHQIEGQFHMAVETPQGELRYVYLHASEWGEAEIESFLELLSVIAEERHGATRQEVWFFHLLRGEIIVPKKTYRKTRKDLEKVVSLLEIIDSAVHGDYEAA